MNSVCINYQGKRDSVRTIDTGYIIQFAVFIIFAIIFALIVLSISTASVLAAENTSSNQSDAYNNNLKLSLSKIPSYANSGVNFDKIEIGLTDKTLYGIDYTDDYYLVVSVSSVDNKGTASYKYFGNIIFPITYPITYPGVYTILLMGKFDNIIVSSASYTIDSLSESNEIIDTIINDTIQNDTITKNDTATINDIADNLTIDYASNSSSNITNITNITNTVNTTNTSNSLDSTQVICKDISLKIDKNTYNVRENVKITSEIINPTGLNSNLEIIENDNVYQFVGALGDIDFIPTIPGEYKIVVKCLEKTGFIAFTVIDLPYQNVEPIIPYVPGVDTDIVLNNQNPLLNNNLSSEIISKDQTDAARYNSPITGVYTLKQITIKDSLGREINKDIKLYRATIKSNDLSRNVVSSIKSDDAGNNLSVGNNLSNEVSTTDSDVIVVSEITDLSLDDIKGLDGASLRLESLELRENDNTQFSIENVPSYTIDIESDNSKQVVSSYAMDLSNLNFTNGSFIKKATGSEVWKCREWNFTEQKCYGTWIKILDVIPGEYYSFEVSPEDPGYAETGLATINTDKGTYHINESVKILSVVLDTNGYLIAGANVTLIVTNPNSVETVYSTESGTIVEESKGIYVANYTQTNIVGDYILFVQAIDWGVNYSMVSSFNVLPFYEFDILRTIPGTIDPWKENLSVNITLISFNYTGLFTYSEKIPSNFTLLDFGGTIVSYYENYTLLTWNNLSNQSTISYSVNVPLVSPNLYLIGPGSINYGSLTYVEARPWYLAIDPSVITPGQVCEAQININGQNTYSSSCDGSYPAACGGGAADRLTCDDGQYETHTGTNNNRWAGVRISSYDSSIVNCDSITSVQLCYEWWQTSGFDNARIGVDNDNWGSVSTVSAVVPGTSANPGATCTDVTSDDNWVCGNFDGTGTSAQVVAQAQRNGAGGTTTLTIDVLYFNVTYNITVTAPTQSTPILNSTFGTNITYENLTCYNISTADAEGDPVKNIFNWYRNGAPFANLNMPFEGGSNSTYTKDYSGYGNNGTSVNVIYSSTGGYDGKGAYNFKGVDGSYINIPDSASLSFTNPGLTIAAWVYLNEDQTGERAIIRKDTQWQLGIFPATNTIRNLVGTSGTTGWTAGNDQAYTINPGTWYLFAFTYNGSVLKHYVNGQQIGTDKIVTGNIVDNANNIAIGANTNGVTGGAAGPLNGTIDQVLILNVSLSAEQMLALYSNRTDMMLSQETSIGDSWMCQITPNDGILDGLTSNSNLLTILAVPNDAPSAPTALTCNGASCFGNFSKSINLTCSGSTDNESDAITYTVTKVFSNTTYNPVQSWDSTSETGDAAWANSGNSNVCYRNLLRNNYISNNGSDFRINFVAGTDTNLFLDNVYLCARGSVDWNCTGVYQQITFGGLQSTTIAASGNTWTDWINFPINETRDYYITFGIGGGGADGISYKNNGATGAQVLRSGTGITDCDDADWSSKGFAVNTNLFYGVDFMEVNESITALTYIPLGNHSVGSSYFWNLSNETIGTVYSLMQCSAIDVLGSGTYSSNYTPSTWIEISDPPAPNVSNIGCYKTGVGWTTCNNIQFGNTLERVRTTCTSLDGGTIKNASFILTNVQDNKVYFNTTTTDNSTGYWLYDLPDLTIYDSGDFNLKVICRENPEGEGDFNWSIAWGTLSSQLISHTVPSTVKIFDYFNFTSRVTCAGGECGYINATLDPIGYVTSGGAAAASFSFDIGTAGTDRLVVIIAAVESTGTYLTGATVDGNTCNLVVAADNPNGIGNHQEMWYCDEDDLGSSSGSVTVALVGGSASWGIHAHLYNNVSQDGPYNYSIDDASAGVNTITVNNVDVPQDGLVVAGWSEGTGGLSINSQTSPLATILNGPDASSTDMFSSYGIESSAQLGKTYSVTLSAAHNRATGIVASWEELVTGGTKGVIPMYSGNPFYTITANTMFPANNSCLVNMTNGSTCDTTWTVNSTGPINSTWEFFTIYESMNYSANVSSAITSRVNITISDGYAPFLQNIQCLVSSSWVDCDSIGFGESIESVRANCTSTGGDPVSSVSFNLTNIEDSKSMFFGVDSSGTSGIYEYDFANFILYDSGTFNLSASCSGDTLSSEIINWTVPWGTITAYLVNPYEDTNVSQYTFFNFISNITCLGGECGYVEATLDPVNLETADSGVVNDNDGNDEEGGSYTDTLTNNGAYYAIGENTNGANDNVDSQIDFTFNLSSLGMNPQDLNNLNISITYCYSGANTYGAINCDGGGDAPEKTPNGAQDIWMFNYNTSTWDDIGDLDTTGGETETTDIYQPAGNLEYYLNSDNVVSVRVEYVTNNGNNNDAWFATDYVYLIVDYTVLKRGAVSTVVGTIPFYTTSSNPQNNSDQSCLGNMSAGNTCTVTWAVNATGELGTVHEFFVLYNMTSNSNYVSDVSTSHINITIANNSAPYVNYVNLTPLTPGVSDNLNCSFVVSDSGPDTLSAIVYWYESDILQYNQTIGVTNGIQASAILGSGNTTASDVWHCAVIPNDQAVNGLQVNSSKVNVSASNPPIISSIECQRFGVVWGTCSNVAFNNIFTAVRATCTDSDGYITNASFTFSNQEDSYTYFSSNYSISAGDVYTLDFFDITISDSGTFNIDVSCMDNSSVSAGSTVSWFVPWGILSSTLVSPNTSINVSQYSFFNFTSSVTCTGGECGEVNATLDPIPSWWDGHYLYRMQLNVTNNQASILQAGYSVNVSVNTSSNKFLSNGKDFRIVWLNGTTWQELDRINETTPFDSDSTVVWFKLQQSIPASSSDGNYYVYYGYAGASDAPANRSKIYLYFDDFNRPDNSDITTEAAYHQTGGGTWSISGNKLVNVGGAGDPNKLEIDALGVVSYDVDMWTKINIYSTLGSSSDLWRMGLSSNMDDAGGDGNGYCLLFHQDHSSLDMLNDLRSWGTNGAYSWGVDEWYNMRFRVINPSSNTGYGKIWTVGSAEPSAWTIDAGNFGGGAVRGYGNLGFGGSRQGDTTHFDDIIIRYIVTSEPTVRNLSEEEYGIMKGVIPMNVGDPFYTITQNPMDFTTTNCLANMSSGDSCYTTWIVNATGAINSTWEFFVNYSSYNPNITDSISSKINITIIQNTPPTVSSVSLTPSAPLYSDDLYCNFTIIDSFPLDILGVNVTWYLNGAFYSSSTKSVTSGVPNYVSLGSGNTSVGQVWMCGVRPYDQMASGLQVNSSNVTILLNSPPVITNIQCLESGIWTSCSNLAFNDVLQGVRANCTSDLLTVSNVTFNFSNTPDSQTYFFATNLTSVSDFWYHQQNVTMNNSGEFRVNIICADNNSNTASSYVSWNLSWGTINISLINPNTDVFVEQNEFFNFSAQVQCIGGECGQVVVTLDPLSGSSPSTGTADSGYVFDNPGNDEEGGSYIQTQTYDGPQTGVPGTTWYYIIGEGDTTNTALSYINLMYNLSSLDMTPEDVTELKFGLTYCHSGEDDVNQDFCDNDAPMEKIADGAQNIEVYDFTNNVWVDIGDITVNANEAMHNLNFTATGTLSNYVNRTSNEVLVRYEADFSDTGGDGFLAVDYATLTVNFTKLKRGNVSTIPGTKPFYTINPNPQNYTTVACLSNMIAGVGACEFSWMVNATGDLNSTHEFYVIYDMFTNQAYVPNGESTHINITISDSSLIPPVVTLEYPPNNFYSNNATINFNCSATDTEGLQNISLYANFSGAFTFNESKTMTGFSDSELFAKTLSEGIYLWNCIAYDTDSNSAWGSSNRTLTVDLTVPQINLTTPLAGGSLTNAEISFNITASDNFDSLLNCSLTVDSVVAQQFYANNGQPTIVLKNVSEGIHYWNVTCIDDSGNYNTSITRNFTISDFPPSVVLISANDTHQQSSSITLEYLPSDNNGITYANLIINGTIYATNYSVSSDELNIFSITIGEGYYSWTVNVSDVSNLTAQAPLRYFTIDSTGPTINLSTPIDNFSTNTSSITFNFTVFDNVDQSLTCDLTIDGIVEDDNFAASNGIITLRTINDISDGIHYWNVTCIDDTGNNGTSETFMLNISNPPTVVLNSPADNFSFNYNNPTLYYTPTDNLNLSNCTLILDGEANATDITIQNGVQNFFELEGMQEGYHNWTVMCYDLSGTLSNIPTVRNFLIDFLAPTILLHEPISIVYNTTFILFNYTAVDNFDSFLLCNLTLDGSVNVSGIISPNGTSVNFTVNVVNEGIHYWNITCIDDAGNLNTSETRNFTNLVPPTVTLTSPASGSLYNYSQNIEFIYQPYDGQGLSNASLYLNGVLNSTDFSPGNGAFNSFFVNFTNDGFYTWQVNATDSAGSEGSSQIWNITIDTSPPVIGIINPIEGQIVSWNNVNFTFNVTDNFDSSLTCNITVDGTLEIADVQVPSGSSNVSFKLLYDGAHNWSVTCADDNGWVSNSGLINFTVDAPPLVYLNFPTAEFRTKQRNITFNYTPQDAIGIQNCSLYINDVYNQSDSFVEQNIFNYFNVTDLADGIYNWTVECFDEAPDLNSYRSPVQNFTVDNVGPVVILNYPPESQAINENDVTFNWTATDYAGTILICNLTIDGTINQTGISNVSGEDFLYYVEGLSDGPHTWLVQCSDDLGNPGSSGTGNFTINQPDLYIDTTRIIFNNSNPNINETINITANVSNIGGVPANNVFVEFWDGVPGVGLYIGNSTGNVGTNTSNLFSTLWNITFGYHVIYINVDPFNAIGELNESNNNATNNISLLLSRIDSPLNNSGFVNPNVTVNFTLQDFTGLVINYSVYVDNIYVGVSGSVTDNVSSNLTVTVAQGRHSIKIEARDYLGRKKNSTEIFVTIDSVAPYPVINTANETWFNYGTPTINISAIDNISVNLSYKIFVNGGLDIQGNITNGTFVLVNLSSLPNGTYYLIMEAKDEFNNTRNSTVKIIYVDTVEPQPYIETQNNTWFNTTNPLILINVTDNMAPTINYTAYVDGLYNTNGSVNNNTLTNITLSALTNGIHTLIIEGIDLAGNMKNSTMINIYVDTINPSINLTYPGNNTNLTIASTDLNFTVIDNLAEYLNCSITLDNSVIAYLNVTNNTQSNVSISGLSGGYHNWNVTCIDMAGNVNTSLTYRFFVVLPDIYVNTSFIFFTVASAIENDTTNITAEIRNIGQNNADNFTVEIRLGSSTGQLLGSFMLNLSINESKNVTTNYTLPIGNNIFHVLADVPLATNGTIYEANESNNNASRSITVGSWQYVLGYDNGRLAVQDPAYSTMFDWIVQNTTGGNIFAADVDSNINWLNLTALSKNVSNQYVLNDFNDLDVVLGMENNSDSINITYTLSGQPKETENITVFNKQVIDIPIFNSTNNSNFITGILWDSGDGGLQFDASQDILFITQINMNTSGYNGTYDFELRVPAKLREYTGGTDAVALYAELK